MAQYRITYTRMDDASTAMTELSTIIDMDVNTPDEVHERIRGYSAQDAKATSSKDAMLNLRRSWIKRIERLQ